MSLNFVPTNGQTTTSTGSVSKVYNWVVSVSPSLPAGRQLLFNVTHVTNFTRGITNITPTIVHSVTTGTTGGGQYLSSASTITSSVSTTNACNPSTNYISYQTSARTRTYSARIVGAGTVSSNVSSTISTDNSTFPCANFGETVDSISLSNITLVNQNICESINTSVSPISFSNFRQSTVLFSPSGGDV